MRKLYLSIVGFSFICRLNSYAQIKDTTTNTQPAYNLNQPVKNDSTGYRPRRLRIDEIDLVSSYYIQDGFHSAVTGGVGTEHVVDLSNGLDLNLVWLGNNLNNKNTLSVGFGFDHHSSASSAYVALNGGASRAGTRIYPSLDWSIDNSKSGTGFGLGAYYSGEYNYKSKGASIHFSQKTADKNGEFAIKLQGYFDDVTLIYPSELIAKPIASTGSGTTTITTASGNVEVVNADGSIISNSRNTLPTSARTTLSASLSYSQMINSRLQVMLLGDVVTQSGYLGLPFHRVYFADKDTAVVEKLPSSRFKLPVGLRLNYFWGDNIILRSYYRYYADNWGVRSNTVGLEVPYKITPFFSISPFYRYYNQSAARYFAPYKEHTESDEYYTSNYEYAKFESSFYGVGFRLAPPNGVFGWQHLHDLEIRYGHYTQTTDLVSDVVSLSLGFK